MAPKCSALPKLRAMRRHVFGLGLLQVVLTLVIVTLASLFLATLAPTLWKMEWQTALALSGAMAKAYENNPDLNAVRAALRATDENVTIAKAGMRPQIAATASASPNDATRSPTKKGLIRRR